MIVRQTYDNYSGDGKINVQIDFGKGIWKAENDGRLKGSILTFGDGTTALVTSSCQIICKIN